MNDPIFLGDSAIFAIESRITDAYERLSLRGLGFFVLHIAGRKYGVRKPDATMLACSLDGVRDRLNRRGAHVAPFSTEPDPHKIAEAFREAIYGEEPKEKYFEIALEDFSNFFSMSGEDLVMAPDGDEAFDDGSYVLQFDVDDKVRLVAFTSTTQSPVYELNTLREVWMSADSFYDVLERWQAAFEKQWTSLPKLTVDS